MTGGVANAQRQVSKCLLNMYIENPASKHSTEMILQCTDHPSQRVQFHCTS